MGGGVGCGVRNVSAQSRVNAGVRESGLISDSRSLLVECGTHLTHVGDQLVRVRAGHCGHDESERETHHAPHLIVLTLGAAREDRFFSQHPEGRACILHAGTTFYSLVAGLPSTWNTQSPTTAFRVRPLNPTGAPSAAAPLSGSPSPSRDGGALTLELVDKPTAARPREPEEPAASTVACAWHHQTQHLECALAPPAR